MSATSLNAVEKLRREIEAIHDLIRALSNAFDKHLEQTNARLNELENGNRQRRTPKRH